MNYITTIEEKKYFNDFHCITLYFTDLKIDDNAIYSFTFSCNLKNNKVKLFPYEIIKKENNNYQIEFLYTKFFDAYTFFEDKNEKDTVYYDIKTEYQNNNLSSKINIVIDKDGIPNIKQILKIYKDQVEKIFYFGRENDLLSKINANIINISNKDELLDTVNQNELLDNLNQNEKIISGSLFLMFKFKKFRSEKKIFFLDINQCHEISSDNRIYGNVNGQALKIEDSKDIIPEEIIKFNKNKFNKIEKIYIQTNFDKDIYSKQMKIYLENDERVIECLKEGDNFYWDIYIYNNLLHQYTICKNKIKEYKCYHWNGKIFRWFKNQKWKEYDVIGNIVTDCQYSENNKSYFGDLYYLKMEIFDY